MLFVMYKHCLHYNETCTRLADKAAVAECTAVHETFMQVGMSLDMLSLKSGMGSTMTARSRNNMSWG